MHIREAALLDQTPRLEFAKGALHRLQVRGLDRVSVGDVGRIEEDRQILAIHAGRITRQRGGEAVVESDRHRHRTLGRGLPARLLVDHHEAVIARIKRLARQSVGRPSAQGTDADEKQCAELLLDPVHGSS